MRIPLMDCGDGCASRRRPGRRHPIGEICWLVAARGIAPQVVCEMASAFVELVDARPMGGCVGLGKTLGCGEEVPGRIRMEGGLRRCGLLGDRGRNGAAPWAVAFGALRLPH